MALPMFVCWLR